MSDTTETKPRRRNAGAGTLEGQVPPLRRDEKQLAKVAKQLADLDHLYESRDVLIVKMYDHGYTHGQIADIINAHTKNPITNDNIGRIVRAARRRGVTV